MRDGRTHVNSLIRPPALSSLSSPCTSVALLVLLVPLTLSPEKKIYVSTPPPLSYTKSVSLFPNISCSCIYIVTIRGMRERERERERETEEFKCF